jgi:hypothetical protein
LRYKLRAIIRELELKVINLSVVVLLPAKRGIKLLELHPGRNLKLKNIPAVERFSIMAHIPS